MEKLGFGTSFHIRLSWLAYFVELVGGHQPVSLESSRSLSTSWFQPLGGGLAHGSTSHPGHQLPALVWLSCFP